MPVTLPDGRKVTSYKDEGGGRYYVDPDTGKQVQVDLRQLQGIFKKPGSTTHSTQVDNDNSVKRPTPGDIVQERPFLPTSIAGSMIPAGTGMLGAAALSEVPVIGPMLGEFAGTIPGEYLLQGLKRNSPGLFGNPAMPEDQDSEVIQNSVLNAAFGAGSRGFSKLASQYKTAGSAKGAFARTMSKDGRDPDFEDFVRRNPDARITAGDATNNPMVRTAENVLAAPSVTAARENNRNVLQRAITELMGAPRAAVDNAKLLQDDIKLALKQGQKDLATNQTNIQAIADASQSTITNPASGKSFNVVGPVTLDTSRGYAKSYFDSVFTKSGSGSEMALFSNLEKDNPGLSAVIKSLKGIKNPTAKQVPEVINYKLAKQNYDILAGAVPLAKSKREAEILGHLRDSLGDDITKSMEGWADPDAAVKEWGAWTTNRQKIHEMYEQNSQLKAITSDKAVKADIINQGMATAQTMQQFINASAHPRQTATMFREAFVDRILPSTGVNNLSKFQKAIEDRSNQSILKTLFLPSEITRMKSLGRVIERLEQSNPTLSGRGYLAVKAGLVGLSLAGSAAGIALGKGVAPSVATNAAGLALAFKASSLLSKVAENPALGRELLALTTKKSNPAVANAMYKKFLMSMRGAQVTLRGLSEQPVPGTIGPNGQFVPDEVPEQ